MQIHHVWYSLNEFALVGVYIFMMLCFFTWCSR